MKRPCSGTQRVSARIGSGVAPPRPAGRAAPGAGAAGGVAPGAGLVVGGGSGAGDVFPGGGPPGAPGGGRGERNERGGREGGSRSSPSGGGGTWANARAGTSRSVAASVLMRRASVRTSRTGDVVLLRDHLTPTLQLDRDV